MSKIITLSEASSIAIHGMVLVAKSDSQINVDKIAEATDSSRHHVAKIFQRLVKEGFLLSQRGPTGGFKLKKDPSEITLLEIYETIEGKVEILECFMDKKLCLFDKCLMDTIVADLTKTFIDYLAKQRLSNYL